MAMSCLSCGFTVHRKFIDDSVPGVMLLSSCSRAAALIIALVMLIKHKQNGVRSSSLLSVFWFVLFICGIIVCRSSFLRYFEMVSSPISVDVLVLDMLIYPLVFVQFIASCFSDSKNYENLEKESPMEVEPFFPFILFLWYNSIIYKALKNKLTVEDLAPLSVRHKANFLWKRFHSKWSFTSNQVKKDDIAPAKGKSLGAALIKTFWQWMVLAVALEVGFCFLRILTPIFMNYLINFFSNDEYMWKGYLYCAALQFSEFAMSVFFNNFFFLKMCIAVQVKSALASAVYRKVLRISNSTKHSYTSGTLTNLISVDVERITHFCLLFADFVICPLKIFLALTLLWQYLGYSCLAGLAVIILLMPVCLFALRISEKLIEKQMSVKDTRLKYMTEILGGIKVLKLYAWEIPFIKKITETRSKEMKLIRSSKLCYVVINFVFSCAPFLVAIASFTTYLLIDKNHVLDPSTAFVSVNLMVMLKFALFDLPDTLSELMQTNISLGRLRTFFETEECDRKLVGNNPKPGEVVSVINATFSWSLDSEPTLKDIDLHMQKGKLIAVIGPVASGKSSLLSVVLGEMYKMSGSVDLKGSLAYVPQQAWILNRTLKQNILLVKPMRESKYNEILDCCCLRPDLEILPGKDETEIGEKGVNLSGGQKQRVNLARAVFQDNDIYLLDDPLSAVDAHVRKDLFEKVISNSGLLKRKTRILVTHDISILPNVDAIVCMKNGKIAEMGTYTELLSHGKSFSEFIQEHANQKPEESSEQVNNDGILTRLESRESQISRTSLERSISTESDMMKQIQFKHMDSQNQSGQLIEEEKMEIGNVKRGVYLSYLRHASYLLFIPAIIGTIIFQTFNVGCNVWLSEWSKASTTNSTSSYDRIKGIGIYGALGAGQVLGSIIHSTFLIFATTRAAASFHTGMLQGVMKSPMNFFDTTPFGRIMNRFGSDLDVVDVRILYDIDGWLMCFFMTVGDFIVVGVNIPVFLAATLPIIIAYYLIQKLYLITSRQIKRLESTTKSPVYSHFLETIYGISCIKAFKVEKEFIEKLEADLDTHITCFFNRAACNRWLSFWLGLLGNVAVLIATLLVINERSLLSAATVGLTITYTLLVTDDLLWLVRVNTELENELVSVERLDEYCKLPSEASWNVPDKDPASEWPENGAISFSDYSTRYREGLDLVLNKLNLEIGSSQKVGIVGRTGAGKSSVTLALFRIIEPVDGNIFIDGKDIFQIGLHALRSKLTIIPQDPVLFTGTLRLNLDPNNEHSEEAVWKSLERSHLKTFVSNLTEGLEYELAEGGENLSVGQRQLVCLARALLKRTKVLVLDEATAAVDMDTDKLIQNTIRKEFENHTVITIAHRLNTIMDYDKIVVMDSGSVVEVGSPAALLEDDESKFYHMAKDAALI